MYRAEDWRVVGKEADSPNESIWLTLEPGVIYNIAQRLSKSDAGTLRLTCKTWKQAVSNGVQSMAVVRKQSTFKIISEYRC